MRFEERRPRHGTPLARSTPVRAFLLGAMLLTGAWGCARAGIDSEPLQLGFRPGYPATTSRLGSSLGNNLLKTCHATLVHPSWALTAAHCFSGVDPAARGILPDFGRGFTVGEVELFPGAHVSGATRLERSWQRADFVAAHDLALVPLRPPVLDAAPVATWPPSASCRLEMPQGLIGELGLQSDEGEPITAEADVLGHVDASLLLGRGQSGRMLTARGPWVGPGDSGSGLTVSWAELAPRAPGCAPLESEAIAVLIGVVQDANPLDPTSPFGLVPSYVAAHAGWLQDTFSATPPPLDTDPPLLL
ncbi:MAG: hypothetical protein RL033_5096 [Pseudomonadota bacterium]